MAKAISLLNCFSSISTYSNNINILEVSVHMHTLVYLDKIVRKSFVKYSINLSSSRELC